MTFAASRSKGRWLPLQRRGAWGDLGYRRRLLRGLKLELVGPDSRLSHVPGGSLVLSKSERESWAFLALDIIVTHFICMVGNYHRALYNIRK